MEMRNDFLMRVYKFGRTMVVASIHRISVNISIRLDISIIIIKSVNSLISSGCYLILLNLCQVYVQSKLCP